MTRAKGQWHLRDAKCLREDEVRRLLAAAKRHSFKAHVLLSLCYNGAFRICEALHLKAGDFDFRAGVVRTIPARRARRKNVTAKGKTIALARPLPNPVQSPLPFNVVRLVRRWIASRKLRPADWLFPGASASCHVVEYHCPGGHMAKREAQRIYQKIAGLAGLARMGRGVHSLKHARLIQLAAHSMDPWFVKEAGRLRSVVTADVYVQHVRMQRTMAKVGGIV